HMAERLHMDFGSQARSQDSFFFRLDREHDVCAPEAEYLVERFEPEPVVAKPRCHQPTPTVSHNIVGINDTQGSGTEGLEGPCVEDILDEDRVESLTLGDFPESRQHRQIKEMVEPHQAGGWKVPASSKSVSSPPESAACPRPPAQHMNLRLPELLR